GAPPGGMDHAALQGDARDTLQVHQDRQDGLGRLRHRRMIRRAHVLVRPSWSRQLHGGVPGGAAPESGRNPAIPDVGGPSEAREGGICALPYSSPMSCFALLTLQAAGFSSTLSFFTTPSSTSMEKRFARVPSPRPEASRSSPSAFT